MITVLEVEFERQDPSLGLGWLNLDEVADQIQLPALYLRKRMLKKRIDYTVYEYADLIS